MNHTENLPKPIQGVAGHHNGLATQATASIEPGGNRILPDGFIGEVAGWVGAVAIPAPSADIHEAGHRHAAKEQYSEPPVEIGEFEHQKELLKIFADKPYRIPMRYLIDEATGRTKFITRLPNTFAENQPGAFYSEAEMARVAELMKPVTDKILEDFRHFKGTKIQPRSLVDEIVEREDIDFDERNYGENTRDWLNRAPASNYKLGVELRGGSYSKLDFGTKNEFYFHRDSAPGGEATAYIGSFVEAGQEPLNTHIAPGFYEPDDDYADVEGWSALSPHTGAEPFGVASIVTEPGKYYRAGYLTETTHSAPPEPAEPRNRVFMRALIS